MDTFLSGDFIRAGTCDLINTSEDSANFQLSEVYLFLCDLDVCLVRFKRKNELSMLNIHKKFNLISSGIFSRMYLHVWICNLNIVKTVA